MSPGLDREELGRLLAGAEAIPACPAVLGKVAELCRDPASSARDLGNVIATDEALTSRLIKIVNSAYYGLRGTIATVTQAVVVLGYQEIRNMVYAVRAEDLFQEGDLCEGLDLVALWDHCLQVAVLARDFCYRLHYPVPEEVFVAGVIHDIGQVILNRLMGAEYREFVEVTHAAGRDLAAAEEERYGVSHAEVGRLLAEKWNFPESLQTAVARHHRAPDLAPDNPGVDSFVLAANRVTLVRSRGQDADAALEEVPEAVRTALKLDPVRLEQALAAAAEEYARIRGIFVSSRLEGS
jgi:putative nucleotidyltransferase with HDIG domain